jgi:subtilisin family serine protease
VTIDAGPKGPDYVKPDMYLNEYTGRGVRVAVIDSGIHAQHPHVCGVVDGVAVREDGSLDADFVDWLGHGTAVAAAIREKARAAALIAVKVFWRELATSASSLVAGIDQASSRGADVVNLSLGTQNESHRVSLQRAVAEARERRAVVVAALEDGGARWLPGDIDGVIPVLLDWSCPRDTYRLAMSGGRRVIVASGYPRDIPNVPRERNLHGISFAVANASGFVARAREAMPNGTASEILGTLEHAMPDLKVGT